jgi:hypothetical protein
MKGRRRKSTHKIKFLKTHKDKMNGLRLFPASFWHQANGMAFDMLLEIYSAAVVFPPFLVKVSSSSCLVEVIKGVDY